MPIEARIVVFGDVYDALRSKRCYKPEFSHEQSLSIMLEGDGRTLPDHFDPALRDIFRLKSEEFARIFATLAD